MSTLPKGISQTELERYLKLDRSIKKAMDVRGVLNDKIKAAFAATKDGTLVFGTVILKLSTRYGFDAEKFEAKHPVEDFPQYYVTKTVFDPLKVSADIKKKPLWLKEGVRAVSVDEVISE